MIVLRRVPLGSELVRLGDVALLRRLVASAEQEQHAVAALCVVDPGTGSLGQPKFQDALADRLDVAAAAVGEAVDPGQDPQAPCLSFSLRNHRSKSSVVKTSTMCRL